MYMEQYTRKEDADNMGKRYHKQSRNPPIAGSILGTISRGCHALERPKKGH
jgi:hypothetical protein